VALQELTKAERAVVDYLVTVRSDSFRGGDLIEYYRQRMIEREVAEAYAKDREPYDWERDGYATTRRTHAWRRQGGTILGRIAAKGWLCMVGYEWGVPIYQWTDQARQVLDKEVPV
jgi:hypothetical protein